MPRSIALFAVLLLGILNGILLAALASIALLLVRVSRPHVAFLGRIPGTQIYSDMERHPDNEAFASRHRGATGSLADLCQCRVRCWRLFRSVCAVPDIVQHPY